MTSGATEDDIAGLVDGALNLLNSEGSGEGGYAAAMRKIAAAEQQPTSGSPRDTDVGDLDGKVDTLAHGAGTVVPPQHPLESHESEVPLGSGPPSPDGRMKSVVLSSKGAVEIMEATPEDEMLVLAGMPASPDESQRESRLFTSMHFMLACISLNDSI